MAKKFYLVDTENVGSVWVDLLPSLGKQDRLLLFYTVNSSGISYEDLLRLVGQEQKYEMIQCFTGRNGLDFQLVSYLGYLIKSNGKAEYVIISNDNGYDAVVRFWEARDISVSRIRGSALRRSLEQETEKDDKLQETEDEIKHAVSVEVKKKTTAKKNSRKKMPDVDLSIWLPEETKGETDRMIEVFQQENRGEVHKIYLGFVKRFGQEKGLAFYRALKPHLNEIYDHLVG